MRTPTRHPDKALAHLVDIIKSSPDPGSASFTGPQTAEIEYGKDKGNMLGIYHILKVLHQAGAVDPIEIDVETAIKYCNDDALLKVAGNASVGFNPKGNLYVKIDFRDTPPSLAQQLEKARSIAKTNEIQERQEAISEKMGPLINSQEDLNLVTSYLERRALQCFPHDFIRTEFIRSSRILRGSFHINYPTVRIIIRNTPEESDARYNVFAQSLKRVFPGTDIQQLKNSDERAIDMVGNPSRQLLNIKQNDPHNLPTRTLMNN
jgi:hypothetical protein